jgi:hypothetical protein
MGSAVPRRQLGRALRDLRTEKVWSSLLSLTLDEGHSFHLINKIIGEVHRG